MATNFHLAPLPKTVDGLMAVPMDIQDMQATVVLDAATSSASVTATINFITGVQNGCPVFDLRQTILTANLDGAVLAIGNIAHHNMGGGTGADMRIINQVLPAGTSHSLQLTYNLGLPQSPAGGSYAPNFSWSAGPRLTMNFGFTDLAAARYLEGWFPSNLIYDQFSISLDIQLINTTIDHTLICNGIITVVAQNHWQIQFPSKSTSLSTLLEIRATDTISHQTDTVVLPISGNTVTIDAYKLSTSSTNLTTQINNIKTYLTNNENEYGSYLHGNRFTVFFNIGGMEYDGGTTTGTGALKHETFHSWWARGMKPASQPDAWFDEAWTTYFNDNGGTTSTAFDFTNVPITLCSQNEWSRATAGGAYTDGNRFWEGISSLIGNSNLKNYMKDFFSKSKRDLVRTKDIEEYLLCRSGNAQVVDAFHRFVYGFSNPSSTPDLWLKDDTLDTLGNNDWGGRFWDSPDIWVRNVDDDLTTHQNPEYGQDNWIYARVRNKSTSVNVKHFVVAFNVKQYAGTQFKYPNDFLPCIGAASGFNLNAGETRIVKAKWPRSKVPAAGSHACLLAVVITRSDHPSDNKFVWESNNLAQKNLTVVDLAPNRWFILPFVISNSIFLQKRLFSLEVFRPKKFPEAELSLLHAKPDLFSGFERELPFINEPVHDDILKTSVLDCGAHPQILSRFTDVVTDRNIEDARDSLPIGLREMLFKAGTSAMIHLPLKNQDQMLLYLKIKTPATIQPGEQLRFDVVQRDLKTKSIVGGIAIHINIIK